MIILLPVFFRATAWFAACVVALAVGQSPAASAPPDAAGRRDAGDLMAVAADGLRPVDRTFFDRALVLSQHQMGLARLGVSHAMRADVRTFAQQLASDHRQIIDSLQNLRRRRGAGTEEGVGPAPASEAYDRLSRVTGAEFDREFVVAIEALHSETMTLFEEVISQTKDAGIRDLIGGYLPVLRDHQNQVTELKRQLE
jgi:putative membrane protein